MDIFFNMMTSSNGNIFRVTGHLCGEFIGHRWIPRTKASDAELWCFLWLNGWVNNREAHYDVNVMKMWVAWYFEYHRRCIIPQQIDDTLFDWSLSILSAHMAQPSEFSDVTIQKSKSVDIWNLFANYSMKVGSCAQIVPWVSKLKHIWETDTSGAQSNMLYPSIMKSTESRILKMNKRYCHSKLFTDDKLVMSRTRASIH